MEDKKFYTLPELPYKYNDLAPYISEEQLTIHHKKHHQAYVANANIILEKLDKARKEGAEIDVRAVLKELSFNAGGHILHSLFWENMKKPEEGKMPEPAGKLAEAIKEEFGGFERFKMEFTKAAVSTEASGWAAMIFCQKTKRILIMQIEKHNVNVFPDFRVLMALDVWEHAYYLDYRNERQKFVDAFWNIVNWEEVEKRFLEIE